MSNKRLLDFDFHLKILNGDSMVEVDGRKVVAADVLADNLAMETLDTKQNILKYMGWAMELFKEKKIEADEADVSAIEDFIVKNKRLFSLVKYQLLEVLKPQQDSNGKSVKQAK